MSTPHRICPDGGTCHHECGDASCWRVANAGPLSGVFPDDRWPDLVSGVIERLPRNLRTSFSSQTLNEIVTAVVAVSPDPDTITRLTVVDHSTGGEGRVFEKWDIAISLAVQDDGRTLKVFVTDPQP